MDQRFQTAPEPALSVFFLKDTTRKPFANWLDSPSSAAMAAATAAVMAATKAPSSVSVSVSFEADASSPEAVSSGGASGAS